MITNDISSDLNAFLNVEKLIACLIFPLITLDHCILSFDSNSSLIWIFEDDEYIAFRNASHFSLNLIFNSFCKFCIESSFLKPCIANFRKVFWRQRPTEAYDISNRSTSYRAQSYDQNKPSFDSITSQMTASQVKNRKSKFFALTQAKIDGETRVHQRRRKNHQFRQ